MGFFLLPWATLVALDPQVLWFYASMPAHIWLVVCIGGLLFGIGQICFAKALNSIGMGLSFMLNIGLGTALEVLLPLLTLHLARLFSLAGVFSAGQNYTFALTAPMQQNLHAAGASVFASAIVIWPPFLTCSFVPYALYMGYQYYKSKASFQPEGSSGGLRNVLLTAMMGVFWFGSLAMYSKASLTIGTLGPVVTWPLFMVLIILTSHFWGWWYREWQGCHVTIKRHAALSVLIFITAVIVLAYSATLH